jgi:hypothetical protein
MLPKFWQQIFKKNNILSPFMYSGPQKSRHREFAVENWIPRERGVSLKNNNPIV